MGRPGWRIKHTSARGGAASFVAVVDVDDPAFPFPHRIEVGVTARDGALTLDDSDDAMNYGVVDEIARRVLLARGRVLAVRREDIPGEGPAAAILRYPV